MIANYDAGDLLHVGEAGHEVGRILHAEHPLYASDLPPHVDLADAVGAGRRGAARTTRARARLRRRATRGRERLRVRRVCATNIGATSIESLLPSESLDSTCP